ncbi:hypothetical protein ACWKW9_19310 [Rhizobium daejeonense]
MRRTWLLLFLLPALAQPANANDRVGLVRTYVDRIVANSLDQQDGHQAYFTEIQLLNDFGADFVSAYTTALKAARMRRQVSLFEEDPMTGDVNRCPIGNVHVADLTRPDTRIMVEAKLYLPPCDGGSGSERRLMFILVADDAAGRRSVIDDVLRERADGSWFSLKASLERLSSP